MPDNRLNKTRDIFVSNKMGEKYLKKCFKKTFKMRKFNNIVEAIYLSKIIRKLCGISVFFLELTQDNRLIRKFTLLGFSCFLVWYFLYFYSTYRAHTEDQTILRTFYGTKLQRYGDDFEGVIKTAYVIFAMWMIPFSLSRNIGFMEIIIEVDKAFENLGENINYNRDGNSAFKMSVGQLLIFVFRLLSTSITLSCVGISIPAERIYQVIYSDALALISIAHFCFFLIVVRGRFRYINKVLEQIKSHKSWEYKIFVRGQMTATVQKALGLQDRYICQKIKACARIYGMLYKVSEAINKTFGLVIVSTTLLCESYIILYMFYFMEATAAGLFHDVPRYIAFLIYAFWQIGYATFILFVIVYFCEGAMFEAKHTSFITHEIMNSEFSPSVTAEALQFSIQFLHQQPVFTAGGLYELNYGFVHQAARSIFTYLVILLQFVTEAKSSKNW